MQAILQQLLGDKASQWTQTLTEQAGFSGEEAQSFLPAALDKVCGVFQQGDLDFDASSLLGKLDPSGLGSALGIGGEKATTGLRALLPDVLSSIQDKFDPDSLQSLLGGEAGGLLGKVGKLF